MCILHPSFRIHSPNLPCPIYQFALSFERTVFKPCQQVLHLLHHSDADLAGKYIPLIIIQFEFVLPVLSSLAQLLVHFAYVFSLIQ